MKKEPKNRIRSKQENENKEAYIFFGVDFQKEDKEYFLELLPEDMRFFNDLTTLKLKGVIGEKQANRLNRQKTKELFANRRISTPE